MEVILKADVPKLGKMLDAVRVKDGFARNFLFPRKLAILATKKAKAQIAENREAVAEMFRKEHSAAEGLAASLRDVSVTITRRVVEGERLYGSVAAGDVVDALKTMGHKLEKRQVELVEPIKQLGVYTVPVKLYSDIEAQIKVWVVKQD
ncbi:MAG TPA: 50S ribosomal protein L9 [Fibrobacteraceae bacterium]|nr:50S ribosomal protein L9 [Fibrobacteraceae bacterium]